MPPRNPPIQDITVLPTNRFVQTWIRWFQAVQAVVSGAEPLQLFSCTVATLPTAMGEPRLIYVSNAAGGAIPAFSDGTNWRRVDTRAIVT